MTYKLTPNHARLWLPVVRELRGYYEKRNNRFKFKNACPLCKVAGFIRREEHSDKHSHMCLTLISKCRYCLWVLFEKEPCGGDSAERLRMHRYPIWCEQSIARLKRWERRLEETIRGKK